MAENINIKLPYTFAKKYGLVLETRDENHIDLFYYKEPPFDVLSEIYRFCPKEFFFKAISEEEFQKKLTSYYQQDANLDQGVVEGVEQSIDLSQLAEELPQSEDLLDSQDDAPVIRLLNVLLSQAIKQRASDIHIESYETEVQIRLRVDGVLQPILQIQRAIGPLLISRIKIMAKLDIAEKRVPQDGRIALKVAGHNVDVRVSTMPASHGERIVMRILDKQSLKLDLDTLGMPREELEKIKSLINQPHGIILVTGPTGSGKTTSLYAMLTDLNQSTRNILTIEDPIEYDLPGIGQTQVNSKVDMTFARGLRAMLRQDPDVVMVGEIRDKETAEIAIQASLTGHLVLSTLHTNSALGAIVRLEDMGIEPFLLASSLIGLIAQRLIRTLCDNCKIPYKPDPGELKLLAYDKPIEQLYEPKGCDKCNQQGYRGRLGIYEVIIINRKLRQAVHQHANENELETIARVDAKSLYQSGLALVLQGKTSIAELLRVTSR